MPSNLEQMFSSLIMSDPQLANDPDARAALDALRTGDAEKLREIGTRLSQEQGMTPQDVYLRGLRTLGM